MQDASQISSHSSDLDIAPHPILYYTDFSQSIIHRPVPFNAFPSDIEIYNRVTLPYDVDAFEMLLEQYNLTEQYPLLVQNLRGGFPIGNMPILQRSVIIPNHHSVDEHWDVVDKYISTELDASRMSGPFTQMEVERILRGYIYSSPLIVSTSYQGPLLPSKKRVCRNLSKGDVDTGSVNSFIHTEDFPTRFDMASRVASAVSLFFKTILFLYFIAVCFISYSMVNLGLRYIFYSRTSRLPPSGLPYRP